MNERIQELAVQARKEFLELPTGYRPEQVGMYPQLMEKFAELIVRECAEVASDPLSFTEAAYCRVGLLKHFGIQK